MKSLDVTVEISTKGREFSTLPLCLTSIALQTRCPKKVLVFDDGDHRDLRQEPMYANIFTLFAAKAIELEVIFGERKGQVLNHQKALGLAKTEWILRVDDDDVLEPNVLELLFSNVSEDVGAVGGLILRPGHLVPLTAFASNKIEHVLYRPNVQWFCSSGVKEVDHLNNSFLFRRECGVKYCDELSPVGHREETMFTYDIKRAGFKVLVDPRAITWHLQSSNGGIRSYEHHFLWEHDEKVFQRKMAEQGVAFRPHKLVVLDCGMGDHFAFKMMLPELKAKYKDHDIVVAACSPEVLEDDGVELISIADAELICDKNKHNIYEWMAKNDWKSSLTEAYRSFLL